MALGGVSGILGDLAGLLASEAPHNAWDGLKFGESLAFMLFMTKILRLL